MTTQHKPSSGFSRTGRKNLYSCYVAIRKEKHIRSFEEYIKKYRALINKGVWPGDAIFMIDRPRQKNKVSHYKILTKYL